LRIVPLAISFPFQNSQTKKICYQEVSVDSDNINGYVTVKYDDSWYLGYVIDKDTVNMEVKISFLEPKGPSRSFVFPTRSDILLVPFCDILASVPVSTQTGRTYKLKNSDQEQARIALLNKNSV